LSNSSGIDFLPFFSVAKLVAWSTGCWYVTGVARPAGIANRTLYGLILSMSIGMLLAVLGILTPVACWATLASCAVFRFMRAKRQRPRLAPAPIVTWPYAPIVATIAFVAWPSIVRPPTDGDTLIYHLPNAASWMHAHSLWITDTHYWWYPAGSEMMAAVLATACGPFALPFTGIVALLALALAVYEAALRASDHRPFSLACSLALVTSNVAAIQGGDLQNDVLLAALVLALTGARNAGDAPGWPLSIALALTKPSGWIYAAATTLFTGAHRLRSLAIVFVALGAWWLRDALLGGSATYPLPGGPEPHLFETSILRHGPDGFETLARSAIHDGWSTAFFACCAFAGAFGIARSVYARVAFVSALLWISSPYSFESGGIAQLALGSALRFGLPAMACGCVAFAQLAALAERRVRGAMLLASLFLGASIAVNLYDYRQIYAADQSTRFMAWAAAVVLAAGLCAVLVPKIPPIAKSAIAYAALAALLILGARTRAVANVAGYYTDSLGENGVATPLPLALERAPSDVLGADGFPPGIAVMLRPDARIIETPLGEDPCTFARFVRAPVFTHLIASPGSAIACVSTRPNATDLEVVPRERD
jgi:hypothetical protein